MSNYKNVISAVTVMLMAWAGVTSAAIYKSVDAEGNVVYTDEPVGNAKPVDLPPLSTVPAPKYDPDIFEKKKAEEAPGIYDTVTIVSPAQDETIRENSGAVSVSASTAPALNTAAGHQLQFYLDGEARSEPSKSGDVRFDNVDRGEHSVEVAIIDANGRELIRSPSVRFHLHRISVNLPPRPTPFRAP